MDSAHGKPGFMKYVCVYAASSNSLAPEYSAAAQAFGRLLAREGYTMVYGGGSIGLMGEVARAVHACGGEVIGVITEKLRGLELAYEAADELVITETMRERKAIMESRADAFVALPGGFGTLEEVIEVLVLKQLHYHAKPLVFLNTCGIYSGFMAYVERLFRDGFIDESQRVLFHVAATPEAVFDYLREYEAPTTPMKSPRVARP